MKRKNDTLELILLGVGILLLLLLFVVKRRLDAPEETATAESRTETMEGKKQEETIQNMEQENAAFLNSKKEEQKETTAAGPVQIRVLLKGTWIRVKGAVKEDTRREARVAMMEANKNALQSMYTVDDNLMTVFVFESGIATIYSFTEEPKVINL